MRSSIRLNRGIAPLRIIALRMLCVLVATPIALAAMLFLSSCVHEFGHRLFGTVGSFYHTGKLPVFATSGWQNCTGIPAIPCPQQTYLVDGVATGGMLYGGPFLVIVVAALLAASLYKRTGKRLFLLFPLLYAVSEISANLVCGTDNLSGLPLPACKEYPFVELAGFAMLGIAALAFFLISEEVTARVNPETVRKWFP
ncbi:MAG: hypothetical protein N3E51_04745 [Candidatus Micrarchaeota archaeon]|nr:hypothetical protein [Candidatus Micrarchaeota archaeon]